MIGKNIPTRDKDIADRIAKAIPSAKWEYHAPSRHRTGINSMFNHGAEMWLVATLGVVLARIALPDKTVIVC